MAKKTLILAFGPKKPMGDEGDESESQKAQAGKAFAAAIKGGDGLDIAHAFEELKLACMGSSRPKGDHEYPEGEESDEGESDDEEM